MKVSLIISNLSPDGKRRLLGRALPEWETLMGPVLEYLDIKYSNIEVTVYGHSPAQPISGQSPYVPRQNAT